MTSATLSAPKRFGELLRRWRRSQGLSQTDFGELLRPKVQPSTVSCWESGTRRPSSFFLAQIVSLTGIPSDLALGVHAAGSEAGPR
jgi:transcriptional regulator with XRE-family HTH domain